MLDILLVLLVVFLILTFFYKQSICEFRINQLEWAQRENVVELLHERVPLVVRGIPSAAFWTRGDVAVRDCFESVPVFQDRTVREWLKDAHTAGTDIMVCPWKHPQAEQIAAVSGLPIWATKWLNSSVISSWLSYWQFPRYYCWAGHRGLHRMTAVWTCLFPVDGEVMVSLLPESVESSLPAVWSGCFPAELTVKDTPFIADVKYVDVVLRPGHCLFVPAHWFVSWTSAEGATGAKSSETKSTIPMVCQVSYHTPISYLAFLSRKEV